MHIENNIGGRAYVGDTKQRASQDGRTGHLAASMTLPTPSRSPNSTDHHAEEARTVIEGRTAREGKCAIGDRTAAVARRQPLGEQQLALYIVIY